VDFGADPTGMKDSSAAITGAIVAALNRSAVIGRKAAGRQIGNVIVSLEGGQYRLDSPVVFPASGGGYVTVQDGALIAGPPFNSSEFLVDMSVGGYVYVSFLGVYFDSQHRGGNLKIADCLRTTVRNCYFSAFSLHGLLAARGASQGHELVVSDSFFAEYEFGTKNYDNTTAKTGTAIEMQFPDSIISNIVALCSRRGVVDGGGNQYTAIHV
jgi:hypothetical protein